MASAARVSVAMSRAAAAAPAEAVGGSGRATPALRLVRGGGGSVPPPFIVVPRPTLFERIAATGVTLVSAPAGSGKTMLLTSWMAELGLDDRVAWVSVEPGERDAQRFWLSVVDRLREKVGEVTVEQLTPAPHFDGKRLVERLAAQLASLEARVVLVLDDVHELVSAEVLSQLELLLERRPPALRVVCASRHDPPLGLHRLRISGEVTDLRDLRFSLDETRELLAGSGVLLSDESVALLHARTEGWVAGLRLAALSLAGHQDPDQFVAEFSGTERTVADYLLTEVLGRQPEEVRRLLLGTSILERVNGALADELTESTGSERLLHSLADANAFVVTLDAQHSWFRYHRLFSDMLRLELRRTAAPDDIAGLHRTAANWFAENGFVAEAVRHAQEAEDWPDAARLLHEHAVSMILDGQEATLDTLLNAFPSGTLADPELAVVYAGRQLMCGSADEAEQYLALAERNADAVSPERRRQFEVSLGTVRLFLARQRGDFDAVLDVVQPLLNMGDPVSAGELSLRNDVRALALLNLGIVEQWAGRPEAERHLAEALELGRRIGRPYVEIGALSHLEFPLRDNEHAIRANALGAVQVAEAQGWATSPIVANAYLRLAGVDVRQARFRGAEQWLARAETTIRPQLEPAMGFAFHLMRGCIEFGEGRLEAAQEALLEADRFRRSLVIAHALGAYVPRYLVDIALRSGDVAGAEASLATTRGDERDWSVTRVAAGLIHLTTGKPELTVEVLAPVIDRTAPFPFIATVVEALLLDAAARDLLGDVVAAESGIERALELAEAPWYVYAFLVSRARPLLERHPRHRSAHGPFLIAILEAIAGAAPLPPPDEAAAAQEEFTAAEVRVLRYLPSRLTAGEIGSELYVSTNTVKTHMRHVYAKLGVHGRAEAVERARELGLLPRSLRRR